MIMSDKEFPMPSKSMDTDHLVLEIASPDLIPSEITALLGTPPSDQTEPKKCMVAPSAFGNWGQWCIFAEVSKSSDLRFADHLDSFLAKLPGDPGVWAAITAKHHGRVRAWLSQKGDTRSLQVSSFAAMELARRHLHLHLEVSQAGEREPGEINLSWVSYSMDRAFKQPDGTIIVPAGGGDQTGIWDGNVMIKPKSPEYPFWIWLLNTWPYSGLHSSDLPRLSKCFANLPNHGRWMAASRNSKFWPQERDAGAGPSDLFVKYPVTEAIKKVAKALARNGPCKYELDIDGTDVCILRIFQESVLKFTYRVSVEPHPVRGHPMAVVESQGPNGNLEKEQLCNGRHVKNLVEEDVMQHFFIAYGRMSGC
jgi:hypothetical protein